MLTKSKQAKLLSALKAYNKKFFSKKVEELDESGTRIMINYFLTDVLGFIPIEEVRTEYMIRGTYADYVVQLKGVRQFLVEVKSLSLVLSDKHLRQAINYGANEGIEFALLTNGKNFDFYKIHFNKPIAWDLVFSLDLCDTANMKQCVNILQFLSRDAVTEKGLEKLWNKMCALNPKNVAGLLYTPPVVNFIKRQLRKKYKHHFTDAEVENSIDQVVSEPIQIDDVQTFRMRKAKRKNNVSDTAPTPTEIKIVPAPASPALPIS